MLERRAPHRAVRPFGGDVGPGAVQCGRGGTDYPFCWEGAHDYYSFGCMKVARRPRRRTCGGSTASSTPTGWRATSSSTRDVSVGAGPGSAGSARLVPQHSMSNPGHACAPAAVATRASLQQHRGYTERPQAPVAQGIERCPAEPEVACSNLAGRTSTCLRVMIRARERRGGHAGARCRSPAQRSVPERFQMDDDLCAVRVEERDQSDREDDDGDEERPRGWSVRPLEDERRRRLQAGGSPSATSSGTTVRIASSRTAATPFDDLMRVLNAGSPPTSDAAAAPEQATAAEPAGRRQVPAAR